MNRRSKIIAVMVLVGASFLAGTYQFGPSASEQAEQAALEVVPSTVTAPVLPDTQVKPAMVPVTAVVPNSGQPRGLVASAEPTIPLKPEQLAAIDEFKKKIGKSSWSADEENALRNFAASPGGLVALENVFKHQQNGQFVPSREFTEEVDKQNEDIQQNARGEVQSAAQDKTGIELPQDPYAASGANSGDSASTGEHNSLPYFSQVGQAGSGE